MRISKELQNLLTDKQLKLLKAYLDNCTIRDIVRKLKFKQEDVLLEFIFLGKKLALYEMAYIKILPDISDAGKKYMAGFLHFRKRLEEEINYVGLKERKKRPYSKTRKKKRS